MKVMCAAHVETARIRRNFAALGVDMVSLNYLGFHGRLRYGLSMEKRVT
jgi:hypothetical protein